MAPAPFASPASCVSTDLNDSGLQLNPSLPFNVTSSNTIMLLNCSAQLLLSPLNCSSNSLCHVYANATGSAAAACRNSLIYCTFVAGGSSTSYSVRVTSQFCSGYRSFVDLDPSQRVARWGVSSGVELQWASPREPICSSQADCEDDANATCAVDHSSNVKRCFCAGAF